MCGAMCVCVWAGVWQCVCVGVCVVCVCIFFIRALCAARACVRSVRARRVAVALLRLPSSGEGISMKRGGAGGEREVLGGR